MKPKQIIKWKVIARFHSPSIRSTEVELNWLSPLEKRDFVRTADEWFARGVGHIVTTETVELVKV